MNPWRIWLIAVIVIGFAAGCGTKRELAPVPVPDLSVAEPSVRTALTQARAQFDRIATGSPADGDLAKAYGELAMSYHAHNLVAPAEAAYANARLLAPADKRWPYLVGHLHNDAGRMDEGIKSFDAALALDPNDSPILFSLGEVLLQQGDLDRAQEMFARLQARGEEPAAALTGLGKVALAKRQYAVAIDRFEEALKLSPASSRLRQPLATAYKSVGNQAKAEENLAQYSVSGIEPMIADPVVDAMGAKVASTRALLRRGQRAIEARRFDVAEGSFRAVAEAEPRNSEAIAYLGFALANLGRTDDAQRSLEEALRLDDGNALAHFSLGVVYDRQGLDRPASEQYEAALKLNPTNQQARLYLADARMRMGLAPAAAGLYRELVEEAPDSKNLRLSLAMAYVSSKRYADARKALEAALAAGLQNPQLTNALARLLATAPDKSVRDGRRAYEMAKTLFESTRHPEPAQTYAMALAEMGRFDEAASLQQETIGVIDRGGADPLKPFLTNNLALFKQRKPVREGWAENDPLMHPRNPAVGVGKGPRS